MSTENKEQSPLKEHLKQKYRLVIMQDETFEELGAYRFTPLRLYIYGGLTLLLTGILTTLFISLTPLRKLIPGYGDIREHEEIYRLNEQIDALKEEAVAKDVYIESMRKRMFGESETEEQVKTAAEEVSDSVATVERIQEDEELRKELEENEMAEKESLEAKKEGSGRNLTLDEMNFYPPVNGSISEGFMPDKKHLGVDIMAPKNTPIKAILDGVVVTADWTVETGNTLAIQHSNNIISFYKHNSALLKKAGDVIKAGEAIAIIGNTGTLSSGPHLHFELWHDGEAVDPSKYLQF